MVTCTCFVRWSPQIYHAAKYQWKWLQVRDMSLFRMCIFNFLWCLSFFFFFFLFFLSFYINLLLHGNEWKFFENLHQNVVMFLFFETIQPLKKGSQLYRIIQSKGRKRHQCASDFKIYLNKCTLIFYSFNFDDKIPKTTQRGSFSWKSWAIHFLINLLLFVSYTGNIAELLLK